MASDFIAGCVGGLAQVVSGHPLDTVKVRLQTQSATNPQYSGMVDCIRKTVRSEGFLGLYKGVQSPLVGVAALNAIVFASYGQSCKFLKETPNERLAMTKIAIAAAVAGVAVSVVECPVDLVKAKMQVQSATAAGTKYKSVPDCAKQIVSGYGVRGIFQGIIPTLARDVPANILYFVAYEGTKRALAPAGNPDQLSTMQVLTAGSAAGVAFWALVYPIDVIKSVMQTDHSDPKLRKYKGMADAFKQLKAAGGWGSLFRGFTPCIIRSVPANAACFAAYELSKSTMRSYQLL
eukprot:TRINITY_DN1810_c0_g1_i2.p1 TRINITY_DN1810_c0_g1~~TRINITY_DN1810_c0_g1_i2.p1  ORF type:complete len:316 (+),score=43.58 TRINITY_DN1810_c0_g1_i2:76-948(+)